MRTPAIYMDKEEDRVRTILGGTPLSAENIRLSEEALGAQWHGTSWFFLMHLIAKTFTKEDEIRLSTLKTIVQDYGIKNWINDYNLKQQLVKIVDVFKRRELGNVHLDGALSLKIDGLISTDELKKYADRQYEYAMGEGLVRYSVPNNTWFDRKMSDYAERFWWHYMIMVFDGPKIYSSSSGESALKALYNDLEEKMGGKQLAFHGVDLWQKPHLEHALSLLEGWERGLITRRVLATFKFGDVEFVAPRFFAEPDAKPISAAIFSGKDNERVLRLIEKLRRFPAYPVYKGNIEEYNLSTALERAGAITIVDESDTSYRVPHLVYLVSRDMANKANRILDFKYAPRGPNVDFGDNSLADEMFRTLGRARAYAQKIIPEARLDKTDYTSMIEKILSSLETRKEANLGEITSIFTPLSGVMGAIEIDEKSSHAVVKGGYDFVIKFLRDFWEQILTDRSVADVFYPVSKSVEKSEFEQTTKSEKSQVEIQIKNSLKSYFAK